MVKKEATFGAEAFIPGCLYKNYQIQKQRLGFQLLVLLHREKLSSRHSEMLWMFENKSNEIQNGRKLLGPRLHPELLV